MNVNKKSEVPETLIKQFNLELNSQMILNHVIKMLNFNSLLKK